MKVLTFLNLKGGCGKTSLALGLLSAFSVLGKKAVVVDFDPQQSVTLLTKAEEKNTILDVLMEKCSVMDSVQHTSYGDIIPCSEKLIELAPQMVGENITALKEKLLGLDGYDYVLIDCPPGISGLPLSAVVASNEVLIPTFASMPVLYSIKKMKDTIDIVRTSYPEVKIRGIVLCNYEGWLLASKALTDVATQMAELIGTRLMQTRIRRATALEQAYAMDMGICQYAGNSGIAYDFLSLAKELGVIDNGKL